MLLWIRGFFNFVNMIFGVVVFGGVVILLWNYFGGRRLSFVEDDDGFYLLLDLDDNSLIFVDEGGDWLVYFDNIMFGYRFNFRGK